MLSMSQRAPGIPVEQPCAADVFGHLQHDGPQAELSQPMQRVQAGESGTDDDHVEARSVRQSPLTLLDGSGQMQAF